MAVVWWWLIAQRRLIEKESSDETAFAKLLAMMYMMVGALLIMNGINNYGFPYVPSLICWVVTSLIVLSWGIKQDNKWNQSSTPRTEAEGDG